MSEFNIEVESGKAIRLPTAGKYCAKDIVVTATGDVDAAYNEGYADGVEEGKQEGKNEAIERYCPVLTESGAVVTCNPVENYPLNVVSDITPIQAGSGDPSPTNPRPISGHTAVKVTVENGTETAEYNTEFGQDAYCGNLDWSTGVLTLTHKMLTLTGEESYNWVSYSTNSLYCTVGVMEDSKQGTASVYGWCSHTTRSNTSGAINWNLVRKANYNRGFETYASYWGIADNKVETWKNFLKEQMANGTPVQILYQLETPLIVQLTAQEILSLGGTNTVYCDTGDTTVTFKADPIALVAQLEESIISLGGEV